ncbi:MAG TPA: ChbG/HpnK family deacetylase [Terriglobales bacterium]|nr:ChbG/HpnK family deacetylase [Terriglobales bacterium]
MRRLVINADDFGLTPGVNRGIAEAHERGVVTSTTLMANASAFAHAVEIARSRPRLSVGCHVVLIDGTPLLPAHRITSLLGPRKESGSAQLSRFRSSLISFARAALTGGLEPHHIKDEAEAQIRRLQGAGLTVSHVDTHKHVHLFPVVASALLQAAENCGVHAVRNPFVPLRPLAYAHLLRRPGMWTRYAETRVLRRYADKFRHQVADRGMVTTDGSFGVIATGSLDDRLFRAILAAIPEGTWEFVCHPGYRDAELERVPTRLRSSREQELRILASDMARDVVHQHGIELVPYSQLVAENLRNVTK